LVHLGIPFSGIPPYPVDAEALAHRVGIVAASEGWCPEYSRAVYRKWFLEHRDPGDSSHLHGVLKSIARDADAIISRANSDDIQSQLASETDVARSLGIFGSPTFVVGSEIFWGDDRLEIAIAWCRTTLT
jgi:2-hydroxychromene-2-carboxylate isomerase